MQNCVTHSSEFGEQKSVEFEWRAPNVSVGDLIFSASVLKEFNIFWVNHTAVLTSALPKDATAVDPVLQVFIYHACILPMERMIDRRQSFRKFYKNCQNKFGCSCQG